MYLLNNRRKWLERRRPQGAEIPISECVISVETPVQYTGIALFPRVTVMFGDDVLVRDVDYALTYKDNVNVGNGTVTVTGIGSFTGRVVKTFSVAGAGGGGGRWDFNIADSTFVEKARPSTYYQSTRIFGSAISGEEPGRMFLFIANTLNGRFASVYGIDRDQGGEYHLSGMTTELSHGVASYSGYQNAKAVSRDGLSMVWTSSPDGGRVCAQTRMSTIADLSSQSNVGLSQSIDTSVAIIGTATSNIAYIDDGRKVAVYCHRNGASGTYVVKFDLSTPYDFSTVDPASADSATLPFNPTYNDLNGILVSEDGMNCLFSSDYKIRQFRMSRAFDFSAMEEVGVLDLSTVSARGLAMSPDGKTLFFATNDGYVHEYALR